MSAEPIDPIFEEEQRHLSEVYESLARMGRGLVEKMERTMAEASADKLSMSEELAPNFATYADAMETYADFAAMNRIIDGYNIAQEADAEKLASIRLLLEQPYFAKIALQYKPGAAPREFYIGNAGVSDDDCRRLVVDWRSPVAEVYYNQEEGATSYRANGRTIDVELKLRRQFDIERDELRAYFDTSVAIQDALLLKSLTKQRTAQMQAITATIQREQNTVIRHEDVPSLLVNGIAGSGKTSVLMQRIAYLFYRNRETLDPREVFLITPNPVFRRYVSGVLPDMGERNPEIVTWEEFAAGLLPAGRGLGKSQPSVEVLERIDEAVSASLRFEKDDFKDIVCDGVRLISAGQVFQVSSKFKRIAAGPHRCALMREELRERLETRLKQLAASESMQDELASLPLDDQMAQIHEVYDPQDEAEARELTLRYVNARFGDARCMVENDEWLRIDRIGVRLLGVKGLDSIEWLYLKMAVTGMGNPYARYVMVDEVQDYSAARLMVLARYFRRAHFLLLGDENQAIAEETATYAEIQSVFERTHGAVARCSLMTSYRSSPQITDLFSSLLMREEQMRVTSVQREQHAPRIVACESPEEYAFELRRAIDAAGREGGLTAVIVPWKHEARKLVEVLGDDAPPVIDDDATLPASGVVVLPLRLAKGLEFDEVIVPNATAAVFPDDALSRRRLYTTISRATGRITILANGALTPLLK